jgi:hypothetical protein
VRGEGDNLLNPVLAEGGAVLLQKLFEKPGLDRKSVV